MRHAIALIAVLLATAWPGCDRAVKPDPPPKIVHATVEVPIGLCPGGGDDCELLRDCYNEAAKEQGYLEAKRVANLRDASITECNKRWADVRARQPPKKPGK